MRSFKVLRPSSCKERDKLRVYMLRGPPGVGKSEFIIWLASQLRLPIYRLSLSNPNLSDNLLAQLLSQTSISESRVLIQVDEFQETLQRWLAPPRSKQVGITVGGFCECLQGATAMRSGIVIVSGTEDIEETARVNLPAVYRRIHRSVCLTWMEQIDIRSFFKNFLSSFVPDLSENDWVLYQNMFLEDSPWSGSRPISVDMLKQYLIKRISKASDRGIGEFKKGIVDAFRVSVHQRTEFFAIVCDVHSAKSFLDAYAPVDIYSKQRKSRSRSVESRSPKRRKNVPT